MAGGAGALSAPRADPFVWSVSYDGKAISFDGFVPNEVVHETLLAAGARLFRAQGFPAVSTSDIGKKVGIAGPGLYRSFSSKQAILDTLLTRFDEWSALECIRVVRTDADVADVIAAVRRVVLAAGRGAS